MRRYTLGVQPIISPHIGSIFTCAMGLNFLHGDPTQYIHKYLVPGGMFKSHHRSSRNHACICFVLVGAGTTRLLEPILAQGTGTA